MPLQMEKLNPCSKYLWMNSRFYMYEFEKMVNIHLSIMVVTGDLGMLVSATWKGLAIKSSYDLLLPFLLFILLPLCVSSLFLCTALIFPWICFLYLMYIRFPFLVLSSFHHSFGRVAVATTANSLVFCGCISPAADTLLEQQQNKKILK